MQAAPKLSSAPKETKSPAPDRIDETPSAVCCNKPRPPHRRRGPRMIPARMSQI